MKRFSFLFVICLLIACQQRQDKNFSTKTVNLLNGLGQLTFQLPNSFDTTYSWLNQSDNKCDDFEMVCFANKKYSLIKQSGFFYQCIFDSLYHVAIQQLKESECKNVDLKIDDAFLKLEIERFKVVNPKVTANMKLRTINGRNYIVAKSSSQISDMNNLLLRAKTIIDGQVLVISYTCFAKGHKNFIDEMESSLETIRIK